MIFKISPELFEATKLEIWRRLIGKLFHKRGPANSKASITKSVVGLWNCQCPISRWAQRATTILGDEMNVSGQVSV